MINLSTVRLFTTALQEMWVNGNNLGDETFKIKAELLVGLLRHFVGRETAIFSTVRNFKEVAVLFSFFKINVFQFLHFFKVNTTYTFRIPNCRKGGCFSSYKIP